MDEVPEVKTESPYEVVLERELSEKLYNTLKILSPRQERIVRQRFGIGYKREYTLEEIGKQLGLSRERVRQIEKKAMERLRKVALQVFVSPRVKHLDRSRNHGFAKV
jgi:RNA polymerase primary sigma factor